MMRRLHRDGRASVARSAGRSRGRGAKPLRPRRHSSVCSGKPSKVDVMLIRKDLIASRVACAWLSLLSLILVAALPLATVAQIVKLPQTAAQEARPASPQTPVAVRVGVDESHPLTLTLFDAVRLALQNNREMEVERINVQQAEYDLFAARGARDITVGNSTYYEN